VSSVLDNIEIVGLNIHSLSSTGVGLDNVKVYTKSMSYNGFTTVQSQWTLVQEQTDVAVEGFYKYTPLDMFSVPVSIPDRSRQAFLVISTQRQLFTRQFHPRGLAFCFDQNLRLTTGPVAVSPTPFEKAGGSYAFNGSVKYILN